jgi:hypothetical protein
VWLTPADYKRLHNYPDVTGKLQTAFESAFNPLIRG